ncbi:ankyrin repeat-containing domain protein [Trichoderma chlorosporum]
MSSPAIELTQNDYTVGWVCALPKEQTAATAMLDQIHADLPKPPNDDNTYTLGSIGKHNIVIACLPKGQYGTNSAATVATRMVNTFPSIKFGLMVGIGGGIPPNVRLGDVVVSTPVDQYPGVVQWDLGKAESDGNFKRTGALSNPPSALLTALTKLETQHEMMGSRIPEYLDNLKEKWPRLAAKYIKSDFLLDTLAAEANGGQSESREMQVHYGLIASGNQVIKDAKFRDNLNKSLGGNILCVEMEAAGLMNDFPCLVIRGICDYADSQKNKAWQEHAAAVAAAFAKELLSVVPAQEVEQMPTIKRIDAQLKEVSKAVDKISVYQRSKEDLAVLDWLTPIDYTLQQHDYFKLRQPGTGQWLLDSAEYRNWLNNDKQTLFCPGIPGAGKTILSSIMIDDLCCQFSQDDTVGVAYIYCNFRRNNEQDIDQLLLNLLKQLSYSRSCMPDIVKDLHKKSTERKARPSFTEISATLSLLVATYSRVYLVIDALDECQARNRGWASLLKEVFSLQSNHSVNFVATSRLITEILNEFEGYPSLEIRANDMDLRSYLDGYIPKLPSCVRKSPALQQEVKESITAAVDGMFLLAQLYVGFLEDKTTPKALRTALERFQEHGSGTSEDQRLKVLEEAYDQTMQRVKSQKDGFCQLAEKVLVWITCAQRPLTVSELQHALAVEVGGRKLDEDNLQQIEEMISVCAGLVIADEESDIIRLVHYTTQEYFEQTKNHWFPTGESDITNICVSYLSFDDFASGPCQTDYEFDRRIYMNCLYDYAARNWGHHARKGSDLNPKIVDFLESKDKLESSIQALRADEPDLTKSMYLYTRGHDDVTGLHLAAHFGLAFAVDALISRGRDKESKDSHHRTPLSWAAGSGHEAAVRLLIKHGARIDSEDGRGLIPLEWAIKGGYEETVKLLIAQHRADTSPEAKAKRSWEDLLTSAADYGHDKVVKLLLTEMGHGPQADDAFTSAPRRSAWSTLSVAAMGGHETWVKQLLARETNTDAINGSHVSRTPLSLASEYGHETVVKLLLDTGEVDPDSRGQGREQWIVYSLVTDLKGGRTPLSYAAAGGHVGIVKLLLETGKVDVSSKDERGQTPLSYAIAGGHQAVVKYLLENGAGAESMDKNIFPRLRQITKQLDEAPIKHSLRNSFSAKSNNGKGRHSESKIFYVGPNESTLLQQASQHKDEAVIKHLLEKGAYTKSGIKDKSKLLLYAAKHRHEAIVKHLLERGVEADSKETSKRTPLSYAAENGHEAVIQLLLEKGVNPNPISLSSEESGMVPEDSMKRMTPLAYAAENGHTGAVKLLLEDARIDPDTATGLRHEKRTPLSYAAENGHVAVVKLLLTKDEVNLESRGSKGWTPLLFAAANGHEAVVKLLLEKGASLNPKSTGWTKPGSTYQALRQARKHKAIAMLLQNAQPQQASRLDKRTHQFRTHIASDICRER